MPSSLPKQTGGQAAISIDYVVLEQSVRSLLIDSISYQLRETKAEILLNVKIHILYPPQGL